MSQRQLPPQGQSTGQIQQQPMQTAGRQPTQMTNRQPTQGMGQQPTQTMQQPSTGTMQQGAGQTFDQFVPQQVSETVYRLEQLESDAEWAHGQAMQAGDHFTAKKPADISQIVHLQKNLLLRESDLAGTMGQCTEQALQQCSRQLQQSQVPGAMQVAQQAQQTARTITRAGSQVSQLNP